MEKTLYRFEQAEGSFVFYEFIAIKETEKGYWIRFKSDGFFNQEFTVKKKDGAWKSIDTKWISKTAKNRYAATSIKEAYADYIARKKYHKRILQTKIRDIDSSMAKAGLITALFVTAKNPPIRCPHCGSLQYRIEGSYPNEYYACNTCLRKIEDVRR